MTILGLDHVQLAMPAGGEDAARGFYTGLLGIAETPKPDRLRSRGGCWFEAPGVKLHLGVEPGFRAARKAHPALLVDDRPALLAALVAAGCAVTADGGDQFYVDDPFGNRIELVAG